MRLHRFFLLAALVFSAVSARAQLVLQDFSSVINSNTYFHGTWEASSNSDGSNSPNTQFSQGTGVYNFTGSSATIPTNDSVSKVEFFNSSSVSISGYSYLSISAQALAGNTASSFRVLLLDATGNTASASFSASDFVTYSTVTGALTFQSGFDSSSIGSLIISGDQFGGTATFSFSFDQISATSAIPEPSTYAAIFGAAALLAGVVRRRAVAASIKTRSGGAPNLHPTTP